MKVLAPVIFVLVIMPACADIADLSISDQMALARIPKLEQELADKTAQLDSCSNDMKKYKIAGISTMIATSIGIAANIKLNDKLKKMSGGGAGGRLSDTRPQSQKDDDGCALLCDLGAAPPECGC
ncbi:hypothetical protein FACS189421_11890 [Bacteroidia bacterium]|nr:hypothetical protein FACS189421_11890 [Bacteroidia bacterium]